MAQNIVIKEACTLRLLHNKLRTVNSGQPTKPSPNLMTHLKANTEQYTRHFYISHYEKFDWLRGCEIVNFIIGPVYFFLTNVKGFSDLNNLSSAQQKRSKPQTYVHCYLQLKLFGKQQRVDLLLDYASRNYVTRHKKQVKKSR